MRSRPKVISMALATHLPQTLAMVMVSTLGSVLAGASGWKVALVAAAVLSGQVAVGWSNDYIDSKVDRQLGRTGKPVVRDGLDPASLRMPSLVALIATVPLSFAAADLIGGAAHILAVASAFAYNLFLSRTIWSWVPYAISFSLLTIFISRSASTGLWPSLLLVLLATLVGLVAHLLHALPDIDHDVAAGVGGLAVSLGKRGSWVLAASLTLIACFVLWLALQEPLVILA